MEAVSVRVRQMHRSVRDRFSTVVENVYYGSQGSFEQRPLSRASSSSSHSAQSPSLRRPFRKSKSVHVALEEKQLPAAADTMEANGEGSENLAAFLETVGLQSYHNAIRDELKVETVQQLKEVQEQDLEDIRMKPEDIQKLKRNIKKEFPRSAFGKLKKLKAGGLLLNDLLEMSAINAVTRRISMKRLTRSSSDTPTVRNSRASVMSSEMDSPNSPAPVVGRRIIAREQIDVHNDIGEGEFGVVKHAVYTNDIGQKIEVAVKSLSQDRLEHGLQEFLKEATSMQSVSHSNIVTFYGIVFQQDKELMLVTEYAPLKSLLECLHNESMRTVLSVSRLCTFAHQIATGMTYLETQGLIHRDLAARNILVFSHHKVKIGDFGLSRALGLDKEYYQSKYRTDLKIPIAWCAPECINLLRFSSASDVWAFGVTMWELFTYGKKPWEGLTSMEILQTIDSPKNERLARPDFCPTEHYALMLRCWSHDPEDRPKFAAITSELTSIKPTLMKAIRSSSSAPGVIPFNEGETIIVIDKKPADTPSLQYWLGVTKAGQRGYFNPTDCLPVQPESSPMATRQSKTLQAPPKKSMKKQSGLSSKSPKPMEKKRFTADMIGAPQQDLRHTGHIGYDGITFGDISFIGSDPVEKILPIKGNTSGSSTLKSSHSSGSGSTPSPSAIPIANPIINGDTHKAVDVAPLKISQVSKVVDEDLEELSDFQFPDLSLSESLSFGTSFIDDMMRDFKSTDKYANTNENNNSSKHLRNGDTSSSSHVLPGSSLKSMSAADEKMIDDAMELANQLASTSLSQANTPKDFDDGPETPSKSKHRFHFKFPGTKKTSPKAEKKSFSDSLASKTYNCSATVTPEAEQAYNMLVAKGTGNHTMQSFSTNSEEGCRSLTHQRSSESLTSSRTRRHSSNSQSSSRSNRNSKGPERPKEKPPLPPIHLASGDLSSENHDDLTNMPSTPPPPIPQSPSRVPIEPVYNNMEAFWREEITAVSGGDESRLTQGKYKSRSDNVSYEDLMEISEERQKIRRMQKMLGKEVSETECRIALDRTDGQIHNAIKYIKLKQLANLRLAGMDQCKIALMCCQWSVQKAADYILDRKVAYANDVIGV